MTRNLLLAALLCLGCAANLQTAEINKQQAARRNYLSLLQAQHEGVRNSTIFRVLQYKAAYPNDRCADFIKRLQHLSLHDVSAKNRMYAVMACTLLQDAALLKLAPPPLAEEEKETYFAGVHAVLQKHTAIVVRAE